MFNVGERVRYEGGYISQLWGKLGTVVAANLSGTGESQSYTMVDFDEKCSSVLSPREVDDVMYRNTFICSNSRLTLTYVQKPGVLNPKVMDDAIQAMFKTSWSPMGNHFWNSLKQEYDGVQFYDDVRPSNKYTDGMRYDFKPSNNKKPMSKIVEFFKNATLDSDSKLLKELGLEDPTGEPTDIGLNISEEISYKANREEIIKIARAMKAEQDEKKK